MPWRLLLGHQQAPYVIEVSAAIIDYSRCSNDEMTSFKMAYEISRNPAAFRMLIHSGEEYYIHLTNPTMY